MTTHPSRGAARGTLGLSSTFDHDDVDDTDQYFILCVVRVLHVFCAPRVGVTVTSLD